MNNNSPIKKLPLALAIMALGTGTANAGVELMDELLSNPVYGKSGGSPV